MKKELILIRHGHSEWQAGITCNKDSHLTEKGILEAKNLYKNFSKYTDIKNFFIISSPLHRVVETVKIVLPIDSFLNVVFDDSFKEASFHVRGSLQLSNCFFPVNKNKVNKEYLFFKSKIKISLCKLFSSYKRIIIFTHGGVIKTIIRLYCGSDTFCIEIDNCSITHFFNEKGIWLLKKVNFIF
ncbi:phosphoglycerate mutase family protein [Pantoea sp. Aalb]|uniref:phosphoglycerate mutase family protein n=1 Tax=Pantoea sp. Aalb TaxID=2576762 RepID=UPI00132552DE|nr:phosphoglycerate mutase family protein [Pantoea sp. Aalb]MXP68012.1 histidine phosphatase family protein [Pantoea sp. Aalb]